jgi:hypothetical protein
MAVGVFKPSTHVTRPGVADSKAECRWAGIPLEQTILCELQVGTLTPEGTFESAAARLDDLADLGAGAHAGAPCDAGAWAGIGIEQDLGRLTWWTREGSYGRSAPERRCSALGWPRR